MPNKERRLSIRKPANGGWIIKVALAFLLFLLLVPADDLTAQEQATALEFLQVQLWPDFDQQSLLILLSGELPADAPLPAMVTLPLPAQTTLHAVARVDAQGNLFNMEFDDSVPGQLSFIATDPGFRIEYYVPYISDGDQREINFQWLADLDVDQLVTTFQQPSSATDLVLQPAAVRALNGQYGLLYHEIEGEAVPAGIPYTFEATYRMVQPDLSAELLDLQQPSVPLATSNQQGQVDNSTADFNWPIVLAAAVAVLAFTAIAWLMISGRNRSRRVIKPRPAARSQQRRRSTAPDGKPTAGSTKAKFCHECGQSLDPSDKFCRNCGTVVKVAGN